MSSGSEGSVGETEAALVLASEDLLSQDNIPDENQQMDCFSCGEAMTGLFCHACGQKNDDYRRSIFSLFTETFTSIFSLENRMWRTWMTLFLKPGKVSREFADGKRTNWTSPVRMYLALSIILFGYMGVTETRIFSVRTDIVPKAGFQGSIEDLADNEVHLDADFGFFRRQAEIDRLNENVDFERVSKLIKGIPKQAFVFDGSLDAINGPPRDDLLVSSGSWPDPNDSGTDLNAKREEALETYSEKLDDIVDAYNKLLSQARNPETIIDQIIEAEGKRKNLNLIEMLGFAQNTELKQRAEESISSIEKALDVMGLSREDIHLLPTEMKTGFSLDIGEGSISGVKLSRADTLNLGEEILKNPVILNEGISKYLPRIMFLMMPFAAIIGLIFIRDKKRAMLYDHLVHATYIHAVSFALLFVLILMAQWTFVGGSARVFLLGMAIYLPISARTMFRRGWIKTIFSSYTIALLYGLVMLIVILLLTARSISNTLEAGILLT